MSKEEVQTYVANVDEDFNGLAGQVLVTIYDNRICRLAFRTNPWNTWGVPVEAEKK